jgi:hypothetical protein
MVLPTHALHAVEVRLKSVSNEGHLAHEVERVLCLLSPLVLQWGQQVTP